MIKRVLMMILLVLCISGCKTNEIQSSTRTITEETTCDDAPCVALYLETYQKLPANYMNKKEARKRGWENGPLDSVVKGMSIGGDRFGNYEETLPDDNIYHECDIDTVGKQSRGGKRIVYSEDGDIWYTEDHYETFTLLYGEGK